MYSDELRHLSFCMRLLTLNTQVASTGVRAHFTDLCLQVVFDLDKCSALATPLYRKVHPLCNLGQANAVAARMPLYRTARSAR
mmetsp:Transcript_99794/g.250176  ORF Transcript_99794/g.250176 Transcript_99794/m.250176 type:complete len:83 (-) Transcript_99794:79-327(-)